MFLKNFKEMDSARLSLTYVKWGEMEISQRVFEGVLGRTEASLAENTILLGVLTDLTSGDDKLDFPFDVLLQLEYGKSVIPIRKLPENVYNYLLSTPYDGVQLDYDQAIKAARELFQRRLEQQKSSC